MSTPVRAVVLLFAVSTALHAYGPPSPRAMVENDGVRRLYEEILFAPVRAAGTAPESVEYDYESGARVKFESIAQEDAVYLLFLNRHRGEFPVAGPGNWIIKRDAGSGDFVQAKVFLQSSQDTFVRIMPEGEQAVMDVYLEGALLHRAIPIRQRFEEIVLAPFARIIEYSRYQVDWPILLPQNQRPQDRWVEDVAISIRSRLPGLADADDGALDSDGTFRLIEDLTENLSSGFNCSGFAKWVVDGVRYPMYGSYLSIEALKRKHLEARGHEWSERYEDERDPYFGLDWTRNLALSMIGSPPGRDAADVEVADVREVRYYDYIEDVGYSTEDLRVVMYLLAIDRPGSIYLGSVNQEFGSEPVLRQHVHVVVLLPRFDDTGAFRLDIMERNLETGIQSLTARYRGDYVHLVEIPVGPRFTPPNL